MLKKSLTDSWSFFKNHAAAFSLIILPIVVPIEVFAALYQYFFASEEYFFSGQLIPMVVGLLAYPIYAAGVVFYIASVMSGASIEIKTAWRLGIRFWLPYMTMGILVGLAVMFGLIFFVLPGIIVAARYAFSQFDLLLNQSNPLDAMRNSWSETKEYVRVIFGGYVIISLVLFVPYYFLLSLFDGSSVFYWVLDTVSNIVYSVIAVIYTIFAFRVYEFAKSQNSKAG